MSEDLHRTITEIAEAENLPKEADELVFDAPWQARAFGLVVTLYRQGVFEWSEFQSYLIKEVQADDVKGAGEDLESVYYRQWITAFERLLADKELFQPEEIEHRAAEFAAGERDASEFVIGESGHNHSH